MYQFTLYRNFIFVGKRCSSNYDCNDPFGTCNSDADNGIGVCECMTLFNGELCEDR